jgi:hypothetical protein
MPNGTAKPLCTDGYAGAIQTGRGVKLSVIPR